MKRSGPLARRTGLRRGTPLRRVTPMPRSAMTPRRGPKRPTERDDSYQEARAAVFQRSGGYCEFRLSGCTSVAVHAHHRRRRRYDPHHQTLAAVCAHCHEQAHTMGAEAFRLGLLLRNIDQSDHDPWTPPTHRGAHQ